MKKEDKIRRLKRTLRVISIWAEFEDEPPILTLLLIKNLACRALKEIEGGTK